MRVEAGELVRHRAQISHANAQRTWTEREGVTLELHAKGVRGVGEAAPLPGYSRDDLATCAAELEGCWHRLSEIDVHANVRDTLRLAVLQAGAHSAAAIFALETALLDLIASTRQRPAWAVLRGADDAARIPLSALAEGATPADVAASAERARDRGLRVVKVKVGGPDWAARDPARLGAIRERVGDSIDLRLDANQALPFDDLGRALETFAAFSPELLEEPTTPDRLSAIGKSPIPLALDESLMLEGWRERIIDASKRGTHTAVVLKPMALGGFERCLTMSEVAHEVGLSVIVTHTFDGRIGSAAAACLALAIRGTVRPCGLDAHGRFGGGRLAAIDATEIVPFSDSGLGVPSME